MRLLFATCLLLLCCSLVTGQPPTTPEEGGNGGPLPCDPVPKSEEIAPLPNLKNNTTGLVSKNATRWSITGTKLTFETREYHKDGTYAYQQVAGGSGVYKVETTAKVYYVILIDLIPVAAEFPAMDLWESVATQAAWANDDGKYNTAGTTFLGETVVSVESVAYTEVTCP